MARWLGIFGAISVFLAYAAVTSAEHATSSIQATVGAFAPAGQMTFEQAFNVKLNLPMREVDFLALLEKLELRYGGQGPQAVDIRHRELGFLSADSPRLVSYNFSNISHSYRVYAGFDKLKLRTETYLALVNKQRMVVYVETQLDYVSLTP